ncbi:NACHT, LRR and PYD domains-containing protein 6-like [Labeo rohita]|uniref:NACHT, LRR and PYD domains-containing protein 6-like n=1 Tax=Labeo rohita TaxID=84645 RepID=UPI0021E30709|nr:NACHT, LRR and PYD domains-containing protein 6-like [Labeo rohita]
MTSGKRKLCDTLDDLEKKELKRFKSYLREDGPIPVSVLEKADATDTVDQMLDRFGPERAVKITLDILKKMNQNHLAEQLENKHTKVKIISCAQTEVRVDLKTGAKKTVFSEFVERFVEEIVDKECFGDMKVKLSMIFEFGVKVTKG